MPMKENEVPCGILVVLGENDTVEANVLTHERTEYGKQIRRAYERKEVKEHLQWDDMRVWKPRTDGVCNTLTSVQKDNLLMEPFAVGYSRDHTGKKIKYHAQMVSNTVHTSTGSGGNTDCYIAEPKIIEVGCIYDNHAQAGRVYSPEGISPCLDTMTGGNRQPKILEIQEGQQKEMYDDEKNTLIGVSVNIAKRDFHGADSISPDRSPCLMARDFKGPHLVWEMDKKEYEKTKQDIEQDMAKEKNKDSVEFKGKEIKDGDGLYLQDSEEFFRGGLNHMSRTLKSEKLDAGVCINLRIRKFTVKECFRLMGVDDHYIDLMMNSGVSRSQLYRQAGNSIVVDVLEHIFDKLLVHTEEDVEPVAEDEEKCEELF